MSSNLVKGTLLLTVSSFVFMVSGFVVNFLLGRHLGPSIYGIYGIIISLMTTINLTQTSGIPQSVAKYVAESEDKSDSILRSGLILQIVFTLFACVFMLVFAGSIARLLNDPSLTPYIQLSAFIFPLYGVYALYLSYYNGLHMFGRQASMGIVYAVTKTISVILFAYLFLVQGAILGFLLSPLIPLLFWFHYPRNTRQNFPFRPIIIFSIPLIVIAVFNILIQSTDLFLTKSILHSNRLTGYYTASQNISVLPFYTIVSFTNILFPSIARSVKQNRSEYVRKLISEALRFSIIILLPFVVIISSTSKQLLSILYSPAYIPGADAMSVLVFGYGFFTLFFILSSIINGFGSPFKTAFFAGTGVLMSFIFCTILIPQLGIKGAAISTTLSTFIVMVISSIVVYRRFKTLLPPLSLLRVSFATFVIFLFLKFVVPSTILLIPSYILLGCVYLSLLIITKEITRNDLKVLHTLLPSFVSRKIPL